MSRKEQLKEYFIFTKGERDGILVLIFVIIFAIFVNIYSDIFTKKEDCNFSKFEKEIAEFEKSLTPKEEKYNKNSYYDKKYDTLQLFSFNPNNTSKKDWKLLGLSDKQIKTINNWQSKGGKFIYKNDFKRIYGISETQCQKLYPYIDLPEKKTYAQNVDYKSYDKTSKRDKSEYKIPDVEQYFEFNPNEISDTEWQKLGFSQKQTAIIRNYLNKGGKFYKKEDIKKIYGIQDFQYERIKDYIKLPEKKDKTESPEKEIKSNSKVDINNLSAEEMKELGKFWQYNATRIVKYRNLLGGYYKKEQLLEVYGMKKEYYVKVADDIIIDKSKLEKININFAEVSELGRHPYISYEEAKKILEYRNKNGSFKQLNDIVSMNIVSKSLYNKISPYLKVK
ncbi:MAG: helix-hairpin-helix domain-containing protein [Bacteroidales bacterium]|nr:helix-hairpin-helix domain-containing protein [Bacteroidales bacterium]